MTLRTFRYAPCMHESSLAAGYAIAIVFSPNRAVLTPFMYDRSTPCSTQMASSVQTSILMPHSQEWQWCLQWHQLLLWLEDI